jgi:CBS domain containing-hemolysin-like protein
MSIALLWMVLLLVANGFFVAAEFAYIAARRNVLEQRSGRSAAVAVGLSRDLSLSLAAAQLGITMATLLLGAVAEPAVAALLEPALGLLPLSENGVHTVALVISVTIVVYLHMVIGEMAPKNIAISAPERSAVVLAMPFRAFSVVLRPCIALLNGMGNAVLRLFGVQPADRLEVGHSAENLAMIIAAGHREGVIEDFAHRLLTGAIVFTERDAAETMVPRPDVVAVSAAATARDVERMMVESGHSRIVVHRGDLDDVVGFVHIKDLLDIDDDAADRPLDPAVIRPMPVVPESAPVQGVLVEMQRTRSHIALVVDEHGSSAGIITLEDIAEELVGDIRDEHDPRSSEIRKVAGGFVVAGGVRPDHLRELGVAIPAGEYDTVGGFLMNRLGRVPDVGDEVDEAGATLRVRRMAGRRIAEIEVTPAPPEPGAEGEDE